MLEWLEAVKAAAAMDYELACQPLGSPSGHEDTERFVAVARETCRYFLGLVNKA